MASRWLYSAIVFGLFILIVLGIPLFPEILAIPLNRWFNVGMLIFLLLHTVPLVLAVLYLRERSASEDRE